MPEVELAPRAWRGIDELAELIGAYCWVENRIFELSGAWATGASTSPGGGLPPALRVWCAGLSRRHGLLAACWAERLPVRAGVDRAALVCAPPGPLAGALDGAGRRTRRPGRRGGDGRGRAPPPAGRLRSPRADGDAGHRGFRPGGPGRSPPGSRRRDQWWSHPPGGVGQWADEGRRAGPSGRTGVCRNSRFPCCTRILTAPLHCLGSPRTPETVVGCAITSATARRGSPAVVMGRKVWRRFWPRNELSGTTRISSGST